MAAQLLKPKSVFITAGNRGIGLCLVKEFLNLPSPPEYVFSTYRNPDNSQDLLKLAEGNSNLHLFQHDVTNYAALPEIVSSVEKTLEGAGLNLLINNAGVLAHNETTIDKVTPEVMRDHFEINAVAPVMIIQAFLPLIRKAASMSSIQGMSCSKAAIINFSTKVASIADNGSGQNYSYRCSKIALNMATKNLSLELKAEGILASLLHPGWVQTEMGGPNALITTEQSVQGMINVMAGLNAEKTGTFYDYKNEEIPW